jgi:hypothetical protein
MLTASLQRWYGVKEKGGKASQWFGIECRVVWNICVLRPRKEAPRIVGVTAVKSFSCPLATVFPSSHFWRKSDVQKSLSLVMATITNIRKQNYWATSEKYSEVCWRRKPWENFGRGRSMEQVSVTSAYTHTHTHTPWPGDAITLSYFLLSKCIKIMFSSFL